jgi:hypothetical protein
LGKGKPIFDGYWLLWRGMYLKKQRIIIDEFEPNNSLLTTDLQKPYFAIVGVPKGRKPQGIEIKVLVLFNIGISGVLIVPDISSPYP